MKLGSRIRVQRAPVRWWNIAASAWPYLVLFEGADGQEYILENPDRHPVRPEFRRLLRGVPPYFDQYGAEVVAKKAARELATWEPLTWAERWHVPSSAVISSDRQ